ncbi:MAG: trigger factor [Deltaproteobacteria bacterium]|jgi:trigger factor|nr:trigger factor [Deltaproteobacteria bacterium]
MEYVVEDISPVKKKINVSLDAREVEAAIAASVAMYRSSVQLDGFRKGKAPAPVVEKRFRDRIYQEAKQDLVNVHINEVLQEGGFTPVSGIELDGGDLARGEALNYSFSFEILPEFELPAYEGMEVEQEKTVVDPEEVQQVLERIRRDKSTLHPVDGNSPPVDGQVAVISFDGSADGAPLTNIKAQNFELALGERQALEDFEALVKTIPLGEEKEGDIAFPADFINPQLAGKTVRMRICVHAVKERRLPELDQALAKSMGFEDVDKMRAGISESYRKSRENLHRAAAQKKLLDRLLAMVEFALPESMVELNVKNLLADMQGRLERQGKNLASLGKKYEDLRAEVLPEAQSVTRAQVFLLRVARQEKLEAPEQEIDSHLYQAAMRSGGDFHALKDTYVKSGMIFHLRDRLLADKAMEAMYAKATIKEFEALKELKPKF